MIWYLVGVITGLVINRLLWIIRSCIDVRREKIEYLKRKENEDEA